GLKGLESWTGVQVRLGQSLFELPLQLLSNFKIGKFIVKRNTGGKCNNGGHDGPQPELGENTTVHRCALLAINIEENYPISSHAWPPAIALLKETLQGGSCLRAAELDGRTSAGKAFDRLVAHIESDLGGSDRLSAIERPWSRGFAGAAATLQHLNTQLVL